MVEKQHSKGESRLVGRDRLHETNRWYEASLISHVSSGVLSCSLHTPAVDLLMKHKFKLFGCVLRVPENYLATQMFTVSTDHLRKNSSGMLLDILWNGLRNLTGQLF